MPGCLITTLFVLLFAVIFFLTSKLNVKIYAVLENEEFDGHIDFEWYKLTLFRVKLGRRKKKDGYSIFRNRGKFYKCLKNYNIANLSVDAHIGLDDAAVTAVSTGVLHSVISYAYSFLANLINVQRVEFKVSPDFSSTRFDFEFECIIEAKIVNIITDVLHVWVDFTREKIKNSERESLYG